ncbi:MAG: hypothetical protein GF332_00525 [Candidatus Moranbacteria bacterium]|nr:hypothetical protein [Candidatus Moranbacteria bacterium]
MKISAKEKKDLNNLIKELTGFQQRLSKFDYVKDREDFFKEMERFKGFIRKQADEKLYKNFEKSKSFPEFKRFFRKMEEYYERTLEAIEAVGLMTQSRTNSSNINFFQHISSKHVQVTYEQIKNELNMIDLKKRKRFVMVGIGPLAESVLFLFENTDALKIVGLDNNQEAIHISSEMIKSIINTPRIELIHCDGADYDYKNEDVVLVANFCARKSKVLDRIVETGKNGIQIILREPVFLINLIYREATSGINPRLAIVDEIYFDKTKAKSLLLEKLDY